MNTIIILFGPTAVGKTKLSINLAKQIDGEIISADSMQVYRGMDIGTAKISPKEMQGIPHHMINVVNPDESFSVGEYTEKVESIIDDIFSRGKVPIIVGGTGLYLNALVGGYDFGGVVRDDEIRNKYQKMAEEKGNQYLYELLKKEDFNRAKEIHPNNIKRIIRALEIIEISKKNPKNNKKIEINKENKYNFIIFGINLPRETLYENINNRTKEMFKNGLINEVKNLLKNGLNKNTQSMQGIGYKEVIESFEQNLSENDTIEIVQRRSRNYAKRQLTFMRGMKNLIWVENDKSCLNKILGEIECRQR